MKNINLAHSENSDISYRINTYPDGEIKVELSEIDHKESYKVITRVNNAGDLFLLMQINDVLTRNEVEWELDILYLFTGRNDRIMSYTAPLNLKIVTDIIRNFSCCGISILEPHSYATLSRLQVGGRAAGRLSVVQFFRDLLFRNNYDLIVFPDEGAYKKYQGECAVYLNATTSHGIKYRDVLNGEIYKYSVDIQGYNGIKNKDSIKVCVIDDLCDGGRTFELCAEAITEGLNKKGLAIELLDLCIAHAIQEAGLRKLSPIYSNIYTTDSFRDYSDCGISNLHIVSIGEVRIND